MSINISERVIELLESEKGKSQNDLALEIGLAPSVISKIKTGRSQDPSAETVAALAKYFNVSADWILGLTDVKSTDKATRDLCATLGLSEKAISVLRGECGRKKRPGITIDLTGLSPEEREKRRLSNIRAVIDDLLVEYATEERPLLSHLAAFKFFTCTDADNTLLPNINRDFEEAVKQLDIECRMAIIIQNITAYLVNKKTEGNNGNDTKA